ncbi:hypothetical protein C455_05427 [Haloferax larsenii JCM 13917]|nr:hypothetical protein [Haloferax larsenii]ELZ80876.1 hypothetical protein C455_05427 [Haloferax larsenii JCM 13917]
MSDSVSSLLTRTQRERIQSGFDGVESAKRRRDERKIRTRLAAGMDDFDLLVTYPDRQFDLAFEDRSDAELTERLADARLTLDRIRVLRDIDRDDVVTAVQDRQHSATDEGVESIAQVDLRTKAEWRHSVEADLADDYRPSRWKRLSDTLLKIGLFLLVCVSLLAVAVPDFTNGPGSIVGIVGAVVLATGLGIVGIRSVKYDVLPALQFVASDPKGAVRAVWNEF